MSSFHFVVPCEAASLRAMRAQLRAWLEDNELAPRSVENVLIGIHEAVAATFEGAADGETTEVEACLLDGDVFATVSCDSSRGDATLPLAQLTMLRAAADFVEIDTSQGMTLHARFDAGSKDSTFELHGSDLRGPFRPAGGK